MQVMAEAVTSTGPAPPTTVLPSSHAQLSAAAHTPLSLHSLHIATPTPDCTALELAMFEKIIATGRTIKSQQRGEQDFTESQLCDELHSVLCHKPGAFLMRFGECLDESDLKLFESKSVGDFEVEFRVSELQRKLKQSTRAHLKAVKNRRYKYLEKLMEDSDYFSEGEMQQREPLLFEYYIGQFLSEEEKLQIGGKVNSDMKLSSMIFMNMDVGKRTELLEQQRSCEASQLEESDSSSNEEEATGDIDSESGDVQVAPMKLSSNTDTANREKLMLKREFLSAMQASFLDGKDRDFDYSKIDLDEQYDSLEMRGRDNEDDYFDTEEPSWCEVEGPQSANMELTSQEEKEFNSSLQTESTACFPEPPPPPPPITVTI